MHLVYPLISGIRGAENGHAELYQRGTSTRATYYTGFNAEGSSTSDLSLDSNGGAEVYVGGIVDVVVKDSDGEVVRNFVSASGDDGVEVRSTAATGTDYVTGASAAGNPTSLATLLDALKTSFGATDGNVLFRGASTTLQTALSQSDSGLYSVSAYGAVGDGATDDSTAVQAAIDAAESAGGGIVFFPGGDYRVSSNITVKREVSLLGVGPEHCRIRIDTSRLVTWEGQDSIDVFQQAVLVEGLRIDGHNGNILRVINHTTGTLRLIARNCRFGDGTNTQQILPSAGLGATGCRLDFYQCSFEQSSTSATMFVANVNNPKISFHDCEFILPSSFSGNVIQPGGRAYVHRCRMSASFAAGAAFVSLDGTAQVWMNGNTLAGGGSGVFIELSSNGGQALWESDNNFDSTQVMDASSFSASGSPITARVFRGSRLSERQVYTQSGGGTLDVDGDLYGWVYIDIQDSTAFSIIDGGVLSGESADGEVLYIVLANESGGASGTITFSAIGFDPATTYTVADNTHRVMHFVCVTGVSGRRWVQVGSPVEAP